MSYRELLEELDRWFAATTTAAGPNVVLCRRGCSACCYGPFDISPADAELVHDAVALLPAPVQAQVRARAQAQAASYPRVLPFWSAPWDVDAISEEDFDLLTDALAGEPCPALGNDGGCLIYDDRPATCRMTGHAMRTDEGTVLENVCPILHTSSAYAALTPTSFGLSGFEDQAENHDAESSTRNYARTTVAGAILREATSSP